jgi:hypothetical protein
MSKEGEKEKRCKRRGRRGEKDERSGKKEEMKQKPTSWCGMI